MEPPTAPPQQPMQQPMQQPAQVQPPMPPPQQQPRGNPRPRGPRPVQNRGELSGAPPRFSSLGYVCPSQAKARALTQSAQQPAASRQSRGAAAPSRRCQVRASLFGAARASLPRCAARRSHRRGRTRTTARLARPRFAITSSRHLGPMEHGARADLGCSKSSPRRCSSRSRLAVADPCRAVPSTAAATSQCRRPW